MRPLLSKEHYALRGSKWYEKGDALKCLRDLEKMVEADWGEADNRAYSQAASYLLNHLTLNEIEVRTLTRMRDKYAAR